MKEVSARQKAAHTRRCELERENRELREGAKSDLQKTHYARWPSKIEELEQRAEDRKERAALLDSELAEVQAAIADLDKRQKELGEQTLEP